MALQNQRVLEEIVALVYQLRRKSQQKTWTTRFLVLPGLESDEIII